MRPGLPEKATHDYKRNGTTTLFAALEVATGKVTDHCYDRHGKAEFGDFLKKVARDAWRGRTVEPAAWRDPSRRPRSRRGRASTDL